MGRNAANPHRHRGQSHAVGRRFAKDRVESATRRGIDKASRQRTVGRAIRAEGGGSGAPRNFGEASENNGAVPRIVDSESSQQPQGPLSGSPPKNGKPSTPTLNFPVTTLIGKATPKPNAANQPCPRNGRSGGEPSSAICWPNSRKWRTNSIQCWRISKAARW